MSAISKKPKKVLSGHEINALSVLAQAKGWSTNDLTQLAHEYKLSTHALQILYVLLKEREVLGHPGARVGRPSRKKPHPNEEVARNLQEWVDELALP